MLLNWWKKRQRTPESSRLPNRPARPRQRRSVPLQVELLEDRSLLALTTPLVSINQVQLLEGAAGTTTNAVFTVSLSSATSKNVTVNFATANGTATTADKDYTATTGTLTITAGQTTGSITVAVTGDNDSETDDAFTVVLTSPTNARFDHDGTGTGTVVVPTTGTATIINDDPTSPTGAPRILANSVTIVEGDTGTRNALIPVTITPAGTANVTVQFLTADGTNKAATAGTDYTATTGTLTFTPGQLTQTITVPIMGDTTQETDETFTVTLNTPGGGGVLSSSATVTGTILTDDFPHLSISNPTAVTEGNTAGAPVVTFTVSHQLGAAWASAVTFNFSTQDGTAQAGGVPQDYVVANGTATILAGASTTTVTVAVNGDTTAEGDENFFVNIANAATIPAGDADIVSGKATGTIVDDDSSRTVSINSVSVTEGNAGTTNAVFTVTQNGVSTAETKVVYTTNNDTAAAGSDYVATTSGTITILAGATTATITVPVVGDTVSEGNENFTVTLANPTNTATTVTLGTATGTGTIVNDDGGTPVLTISGTSVAEGNSGTTNALFNVSLSQASVGSTTVQFTTASGTATSGSDFSPTTGTLTIANGTASGTITVPIIGDTAVEGSETFTVVLSSATNGAVIGTGTGTGTIVDDDGGLPVLNLNSVSVVEGNSGTTNAIFTASLSATSGSTTTVFYSTSNGTGTAGVDYSSTSGTLIIPAGSISNTITVPVIGDLLVEGNENFFVTLSSLSSNASLGTAIGTGTILDDDVPNFSVNNISITEGNSGTTNGVFTVTLNQVPSVTTTVNFSTSNVSAVAGSDYNATSGTLTFAPGVTTSQVTVQVIGDNAIESNETFLVSLSNPSNSSLTTGSGTGTIVDDDGTLPTISINNPSIQEGNSGTSNMLFTVSLSGTFGLNTTVNFATSSSSATAGSDFTATSGTVTIPAGQTTATVTVPIIGDTAAESNETFTVALSTPSNGVVSSTAGTGTGTIVNDDGIIPSSGVVVTGVNTGSSSQVVIYDASTGSVRFTLTPYDPAFTGGVRVATGDINGDGVLDIITGPGPGGGPHIRIFDGKTGTTLNGPLNSFLAFSPNFIGGVSVAAGDVNGDGFDDVIVGAGPGGGPHVQVFSGASAAVLLSFFAFDTNFFGGITVAATNVNGDGRDEIIVGAGPGGGSHVKVFDGLTGGFAATPVNNFFAFPGFFGGTFVAGGDVNGDGFGDVIVGAGPGGGPHVKAFSGSTGAVLSSFFAYDGTFNLGVRVNTTDGNGDGRLDIETRGASGNTVPVRIFDALSLALLDSFFAVG